MVSQVDRLRSLAEEYKRLRELAGYTPQSRGQRFNGFLKELLESWGIPARADLHSSGNIDVAFETNGVRFILEAKWESEPTNTDRLAKLQKRVRQRLGGTIGLFLSMSGYTDPALGDLKQGDRLELLLMTTEHLEALLTGIFPPDELLGALLRRASFAGEPSGTLVELFSDSEQGLGAISFDPPGEVPILARRCRESLSPRVVVSNLPYGQSGVCELRRDVLILTLMGGLAQIDLARRSVIPLLAVAGCSRNVLVRPDRSILFVRRFGIGRSMGGAISAVAGGGAGNMSLSVDSNGVAWAFCNSVGDSDYNSDRAMIMRLGDRPGDEVTWVLDYPGSSAANAAWISDHELLIVGGAGLTVFDTDGSSYRIDAQISNPMGLMSTNDGGFIIAADFVRLFLLDTDRRAVEEIADLNLAGSVSELAPSALGGGYLFSHYSDAANETKGIVVCFDDVSPPRPNSSS